MNIRKTANTRLGTTNDSAPEDDWRKRAECSKPGYETDLWFPVGETGLALLQANEAKRVCQGCPVKQQCLNWAMTTQQADGVWGGMTTGERRELKADRMVWQQQDETPLFDEWLRGEAVELSREQMLRAIARGVGRGMSYTDIDRATGYAPQWVASFVSRMRKQYKREGRVSEFPVSVKPKVARVLTHQEVRQMREAYAAGGVTDLELAMRYGVARNAVSDAVSGRTYKTVGGPIRPSRSERSLKASRVMKESLNALSFAASSSNKSMEKVA